MGTQSITPPQPRSCAPIRIALLLLLALSFTHPVLAQSSAIATTVPLILPSAIVYDAAENLYLADTGSHTIGRVDATGHITTIAGTGTQGYSGDNGPATAALLDSPQGLAFDAIGNLYIADTHNHVVRRLNLGTGIITTIAGVASPGFDGDNGLATRAHLSLPTALALDSSHNLYFADTGNHRIRRIDANTGIITTIAGTGTQGYLGDNGLATNAAIDSPTGLAVDTSNNLYLADTHNHRIRRIDAGTGIITIIAGTDAPGFSGDNASASVASIALPHGLTIDAEGNIYFADTSNHRIRRIDAGTGVITTVAGSGTQSFSGDNGPAITAALDTPRGATLSPANLLTFADAANQRIRQLTAAPGSTATINTIAGLSTISSEVLTITAPSVLTYGTGSLTATLAANTSATGLITFMDTTNANAVTLGTVSLVSNVATFPIGTLSAGTHNIVATYLGDQTHASAQSAVFTLTVTPQQLTATINPVTLLYGQPIPVLTGILTGVLPQDASSLAVTYTTTAVNLSTVGAYSVTASITGAAAGNYTLTTASAPLTILPAPTLTTLNTGTTATGTPTPITTHVASTTSGAPTGTVTIFDGITPISSAPVSPTGDTTLALNPLAAGSHTLTARYSGDANFTSSISMPSLITIGSGSDPGADFTLASTGPATQTILSGASATYTFSIQTQGSIASPITLAASGLPNLATASFNPAYIPPGGPSAFTLTIATPKTSAGIIPISSSTWAILLLPLTGLALRTRNRRPLFALATLSLALPLCSGCGARVNSTNSVGAGSTQTKTYTITVTGTATTANSSILQHAATVTLSLQDSN